MGRQHENSNERRRFKLPFITLVELIIIIAGLAVVSVVIISRLSPPEENTVTDTPDVACANDAIQISMVYMPLSEDYRYLPTVINDFNAAYIAGKNPITGEALAAGERAICVIGSEGSSGRVMQGIVNAVIAPNNANVERPTLYQPAVSHWLALANELSRQQLFREEDIFPMALSPVGIAIWESRLEAIRETVGYEEIGWEELLDVLHSPNGWCDYGIPDCRRTVYYGHTNPYISSTGISTLIAEFYASARRNGFTGRQLSVSEVDDEDVQQGVRDIEALIRHYSRRTTEFKFYIAQGPEYLDFVALPENDIIWINRETKTPEPLVALYPKEGTFWHEHPFAVVHADWTTEEQREAARIFSEYALTPDVQELIMSKNFRPANPDVPLAYPIAEELGIPIEGPSTVLDVPDPDVIAAIQRSWSFVKKQADVMLVIDISGSMGEDEKLEQAKTAALTFLDNMESTNRVGLAVFNESIDILVPLGTYESVEMQMRERIMDLQADGGTELFAAIRDVVTEVSMEDDSNRIRAVVILSDGADTGEQGVTLNDAVKAINVSRDSLNPVIVIPVAYGADADVAALNSIARASATNVQAGDPQSILAVLEIISSYF